MEISKQHVIIEECIFHCKVHVFLNYAAAEFEAFAKEKGWESDDHRPEFDDNFAGFSSHVDGKDMPREWIVGIKLFDWTLSAQNTLIHEVAHTVIKIWDFNNIPVDIYTQEFFAHTVANLCTDIADKILPSEKHDE
jgi:hypothetical protein